MPEPSQVTSKTVPPPNPLASDLEDLQQYAVSLFIEKLAISLAFAILSAFIVFVTAMFNDVRFMTAFFRAIFAFFISGVAAALVSNVLDMQEDYYKMKNGEVNTVNPNNIPSENSQQNINDTDEQAEGFKPLDEQSLPNVNNNQR
ncbi:MAG: hypothetical protein IJ563_04555 [Selenomonadaceae bacterium]|nr:hypothetical protein [Selenomonadaceae bacterium]MBR1857887.1 hypothetical protein [Selenomonadaceae bacterium]